MEIQLDHLLVPSKDKNGAAKLLAEILGVRRDPAAPPAQPPLLTVSDISDEQWGSTEHSAPAFPSTTG